MQQQLFLSMCNWIKINLQAAFAKEQDLLEMIRILHAARMEAGGGKTLDLELLFNQIGGIFKPCEEAPYDDGSLQAALLAQVRKTHYENRGAAVQDRTGPKKNQESRFKTPRITILPNCETCAIGSRHESQNGFNVHVFGIRILANGCHLLVKFCLHLFLSIS